MKERQPGKTPGQLDSRTDGQRRQDLPTTKEEPVVFIRHNVITDGFYSAERSSPNAGDSLEGPLNIIMEQKEIAQKLPGFQFEAFLFYARSSGSAPRSDVTFEKLRELFSGDITINMNASILLSALSRVVILGTVGHAAYTKLKQLDKDKLSGFVSNMPTRKIAPYEAAFKTGSKGAITPEDVVYLKKKLPAADLAWLTWKENPSPSDEETESMKNYQPGFVARLLSYQSGGFKG